MISTSQLNNNALKHKMKVTESRLRGLIQGQIQSRYFDKIQDLSSRLDLAAFENKRLRERFSSLQKQVVHMKEAGGQWTGSQAEVINKNVTKRKHVGIQVELGFPEKDEVKMDLTEHNLTSTSSFSVDQSEVGSLNSSKGMEQTAHACQIFVDLLLGGWGFETRSCGRELSNLPSSLTVTPIKRKPSATALCSTPASVFITPEVASVDIEQPTDQRLSLFPTPDITPPPPPHRSSSFIKSCKRKLNDNPAVTIPRSAATCPVFLRKISVNQGKVAISWNIEREASSSREISQISSYELYQASPVKMWQLVGAFQAMKLPIAVVMSAVKQMGRYQLRLKVIYDDGTFVFSNILSLIA